MATDLLSRLRALAKRTPRLTINGTRHRSGDGDSILPARTLFSRLAMPGAELVRADASWQPKPLLTRVEIIASGPFNGLRGIGGAVNRLQHHLVTAIRNGVLELRLTEIRPTCRHSTAWTRDPVDPGASTTIWECFVDAFAEEHERSRMLFAQAFRESIRNRVNHIVMFGDRFDDGILHLGSAIRAFRQHGIRVSTFHLGDDFSSRSIYDFLAVSTGGLFLHLSDQRSFEAVLPIVTAFACGDRTRLAALSSSAPEARALIAQLRRQ